MLVDFVYMMYLYTSSFIYRIGIRSMNWIESGLVKSFVLSAIHDNMLLPSALIVAHHLALTLVQSVPFMTMIYRKKRFIVMLAEYAELGGGRISFIVRPVDLATPPIFVVTTYV